MIASNRVGLDFNGLNYNGQSAAYDAMGNTIAIMNDSVGYTLFKIRKDNLSITREKIPFLKDKDVFGFL